MSYNEGPGAAPLAQPIIVVCSHVVEIVLSAKRIEDTPNGVARMRVVAGHCQ